MRILVQPSWAGALIILLLLGANSPAQESDRQGVRGRHVILIVLAEIDAPTWAKVRPCPAFGAWRSFGTSFARTLAHSDDPDAARAALLGGAGAGTTSLSAFTSFLDGFDRQRFFEENASDYFAPIAAADRFARSGEAFKALRNWIEAGGGSFFAGLHLRDGEALQGATGGEMASRAARLDCAIAEFMTWLKSKPVFAETLVVVIGDSAAGGAQAPEVPCCVLGGGLEAGLVDRELVLAQMDILPTLFAFTGRRAPAFPGRSLFDLMIERPSRDLVCESGRSTLPADFQPSLETIAREVRAPEKVLLQRDGFRLLHDRRQESWQLFDLALDPGANSDLAARNPQLLRSMRGRLEHWLRLKSWRLLAARL